MGAIQLPDDLQRAIERQVAEGRAASAAAFVEEAVLRLIEASLAEDQEVHEAVRGGIADMAAGRFTTIATPEEDQRLHERLMARVRSNLLRGQ